MTQRTRTRTPRRVKDWADIEVRNESLSANGKQLSSVLNTYYLARGVSSVPGLTVMRIIGSVTVKSNSIQGSVDVHFGIRVADKDVDIADFPVPYIDSASWMWIDRVIDTNLLNTDGAVGVIRRHRIDLDVGSRRRLRAVDDRLRFFAFNSDATNSIAYSFSLRVLLALP